MLQIRAASGEHKKASERNGKKKQIHLSLVTRAPTKREVYSHFDFYDVF